MGLHKKHEEHENHERWLVSYADFITLLFAFFTVLYALSMSDKAKYKNAVENIQRSFLAAGGIFPLRGSPFTPFERPADKGSGVPPSPNEAGQYSSADQSGADRLSEQVRGLFERTTGVGLEKGNIDIARTDMGYKIRLNEALLFRPGSDKLRRDHLPFLYEVGKRLARLNSPLQIEGHTDTMQGVDPSAAWKVSMSRSYNVMRFLVDGAGLPPSRVGIAAYGDSQPVANNDTAEGRARNRRVEIAIIAPNHSIETLDW